MREFQFVPAADAEFQRAIRWHAAQRLGLGDEFVSDIQEAVERAVRNPDAGSPHLFGTRRMLVDRFHYDVIYIERDPVILVIAVAHQRRKRGYWRKRLNDI